jgi:hypothetical protein
LLVPLVHRDRKASKALPAIRAQPAQRGHKGTPARPDLRVMLLPFPARLVLPARLAHKGFRAITARLDPKARKASKAIRVHRATLGLPGRRVLSARPGLPERKESKATPAQLDLKDRRAIRASKVTPALPDPPAHRALKALQGQPAPPEPRALSDPLGLRAHRAFRATQDRPALKGCRAFRVFRAIPAPPARQALRARRQLFPAQLVLLGPPALLRRRIFPC